MRRGEAKETRSGGNRKHKNGLSGGAKPSAGRRTAAEVTYSILSLDGITRIAVTHALEETLLRRFDGILRYERRQGRRVRNIRRLDERKKLFLRVVHGDGNITEIKRNNHGRQGCKRRKFFAVLRCFCRVCRAMSQNSCNVGVRRGDESGMVYAKSGSVCGTEAVSKTVYSQDVYKKGVIVQTCRQMR